MASPYELFMLVLCCLVLAMLAVEYLAPISQEDMQILLEVDMVVCAFFLLDFLISLYKAPDRKRYFLTWGWLDLISSIPVLTMTRWGRLARVARLVRLLRGVRSAREIFRFLGNARRAESTVFVAMLMGFVLLTFASIAILHIEGPIAGGIEHASDAVWWTMVTATSVGYGDLVPTTLWGKVVGICVALVGITLFGVFTAFLASWLLAPGEDEQERELETIRKELQELKALLLAAGETAIALAPLATPERSGANAGSLAAAGRPRPSATESVHPQRGRRAFRDRDPDAASAGRPSRLAVDRAREGRSDSEPGEPAG